MAISASLLSGMADAVTTNTTSYTTASGVFVPNHLYTIHLGYARDTVDPEAPTISGGGLTWVLVKDSAYKSSGANRTAMAVFRAMGSGATTGALTVSFGYTATGCIWHVLDFTGTDLTGSDGSAAVTQPVVAVGAPANGANFTTSLNDPFDVNSRTVYALASNSAAGYTTEGGYTTFAAGAHTGPNEYLLSAWNPTTFDTSISATNGTGGANSVGIIAYEVRPPVIQGGLFF